MSRRVAGLLAALALGLLPGVAAAQTEALQINAVDLDHYPTVSVTVSSPRELAGRQLPPEAFRLTEQGDPRDVNVHRLPGDQLEVVLVIDTSGSMDGPPLAAAQNAASDFVLGLPQGVRVAVIAFDDVARVISPFTTDPVALVKAVRGLRAHGNTALYDAVGAAFGELPSAQDAQRTVVMLSDGRDTRSKTTLDAATATLRDAGAGFYVIGLDSPEADPVALGQLAAATGGRVVPANDLTALAGVYERIAAEVSNQYRLTYRSKAHGPAAIQVQVSDRGVTAAGVRNIVLPDTPYSLLDPVILGGRYGLVVGAAVMYLALTLTILLILAPRQRRARLAPPGGGATPGVRPRISGVSELADWATELAERGLQQRGWSNALNAALERAGINLRPGEFVVLGACAALTATAVGLVLSGALLALLLVLGTVLAFRLGLSVLADRRRAKFADQLGDTLQLLAGSLRAGYSILQAIDAVAQEADSPTAEEFRRLVVENRLGRDLPDALNAMARRADSEDFEWVVQAIVINREVGGDLAEVLDTVAKTIRERNQIRRQVKALSAEGRLSGAILLILPFAVGGFILLTSPDYLRQLTDGPVGWGMLGVGAVLMTGGALWIRKIANIAY